MGSRDRFQAVRRKQPLQAELATFHLSPPHRGRHGGPRAGPEAGGQLPWRAAGPGAASAGKGPAWGLAPSL